MKKHGFTLLGALVMTWATVHADPTSSFVWSRGQVLVPQGPAYYTIWKMRDDGGGQTALTTATSGQDDRRPSICTSGRKIVFDRTSAGETDIFKMSTAGTGQTNITSAHPGVLHEDPDCGLDGSTEMIVYRSTEDQSAGEIYKMDPNGDKRGEADGG